MKRQGCMFGKIAFAGMVWMGLVLSTYAETIVVTNVNDTEGSATNVTLRWAINQANVLAAAGTDNTIIDMTKVGGLLFLASDLPPIYHNTVIKGSTETPLTIYGINSCRIFSVLSGRVTIKYLTLSNAFAKGGNGGNGVGLCGGGGGGAGIGAALFIYKDSRVNCSDVVFTNNSVLGGNGGYNAGSVSGYQSWSGSGGGFLGNGSTASNMGGVAGGSGGMLGAEGQGGWSYTYYNYGSMNGGFGGGGGCGDATNNNGGAGGFGGGGGGYSNTGSGNPGSGGSFGGDANGRDGGGGAGLGGAIYAGENTTLVLENCTFTGNSAHHGTGGFNGQGKGGAIFAKNNATVVVKGFISFLNSSNGDDNAADDATETGSFDPSFSGQKLDIPAVHGVLHITEDDTTAFPPSAAPNWSLYR